MAEAHEKNDPRDVGEPSSVEPTQRLFVQRNYARVKRVGR
jgi:hypothetical protein